MSVQDRVSYVIVGLLIAVTLFIWGWGLGHKQLASQLCRDRALGDTAIFDLETNQWWCVAELRRPLGE